MGKMSLLGMGVIEVRGSDTCWRGREGLDSGIHRNDGGGWARRLGEWDGWG